MYINNKNTFKIYKHMLLQNANQDIMDGIAVIVVVKTAL